MPKQKSRGPRGVQGTVHPVKKLFETLFEHAPCMMHVIDERRRLVKVNRRWLEVMDYQSHEVLGRSATEFLTDSSRSKFVNVTFPALWRRGYARDIPYEFVRRDGEVLEVLLDGELIVDSEGNRFSIGTIRVVTEGPRNGNIVLQDLIERFEDMTLSLRIIARAQEEGVDILREQMQELILLARDIERTLRHVGDALASSAG